MLFYGVAKVIPTQMPEPPLAASGLWALAGCVLAGWQSWHSHAIWSVTEFIAEGRPLVPLTTDEIRWQRIIFDERC